MQYKEHFNICSFKIKKGGWMDGESKKWPNRINKRKPKKKRKNEREETN